MTINDSEIKSLILKIYAKKHSNPVEIIHSTSLRSDLGFDSFDFAELTVKIEDLTGVDIFENRIVDKYSEILEEIQNGSE